MGFVFTLRADNNSAGQHWKETSPYGPRELQKINDSEVEQLSAPVGSIPTPFAQFHLIEYAFSIANDTGVDGHTFYHKMISQTLDIFEILYHGNDLSSRGLKILTWDIHQAMAGLKSSGNASHRNLGETLDLYATQDKNFDQFSEIHIFMYNGEIIGGTSPLTIVCPSPNQNTLGSIGLMNSKGQPYFQKNIPLHERDAEFQLYLHKFFEAYREIRSLAPAVFSYLSRSLALLRDRNKTLFQTITALGGQYSKNDFAADYKPIEVKDTKIYYSKLNVPLSGLGSQRSVAEGSDFKIKPSRSDVSISTLPLVLSVNFNGSPGLKYVSSKWQDIHTKVKDFLRENQGKLPVDISDRDLPATNIKFDWLTEEDFFEDVLIRLPYKNDRLDTQHFFLLTGKKDSYLLPIKLETFSKFFEIKDLQSSLAITQESPDSVQVTLKIPIQQNENVSLKMTYHVNPQLQTQTHKLITDQFIDICVFPFIRFPDGGISQYSVMFAYLTGESPKSLKFLNWTNSKTINGNEHIRHTPATSASVYYNIESNFDAIAFADSNRCGWTIPRWKPAAKGYKEFEFAIDFGTTSTHVAYREKNDQLYGFSWKDTEGLVANLYTGEDRTEFRSSLVFQRRDFIPAEVFEISNEPKNISFPIRTALSKAKSATSLITLQNANVAFYHEKTSQYVDEEVLTNLKWSFDLRTEDRVKCFLEEILLLIRAKVLLNEGDLGKTKITWFYPLSMTQYSRGIFENQWSGLSSKILGNPTGNVKSFSESEAPYYYHRNHHQVVGQNPVLCIDIGGGSVDVVVFNKDKPCFGTSFNFGSNILWSEGKIENDRRTQVGDNGFFVKYMKHVKEGAWKNEFLRDLKNKIGEDSRSVNSIELIQACFTNDDETRISDQLTRDGEMKAAFVIYFGAIFFHALEMLRDEGLKPAYVCLSGNGSRVITFLDQNRKLPAITEFIQILSSHVYDTPMESLEVILSSYPKQVTSQGGLFAMRDGTAQVPTKVFHGDSKLAKVGYNNFTAAQADLVVDRVEYFLDLLTKMSSKFSYRDKFGMDKEMKFCCEVMRKKLKDHLMDHLELKKMESKNENEPITESLFFYPLGHGLYNLTKELV